MKRLGAVLFWVGLVLAIVSAGVAFFGGSRAVDAVRSAVDDAARMPGGTATIQLDEGDRSTIYERTQSASPSASCEVAGPDGSAPALSRSSDLSGSLGDVSYVAVGEFRAPVTGDYTVSCTGGSTVVGPSLDFGTLGSGALALLGGIVGVGVGLLFLVVGAIMWFVGRSRARNDDRQTASYGQPPPGPGQYGRGSSGGRPPPPPPPSG